MVSIIKREYETNTYHFAVDTVAELDLLPKIRTRGKDILNTIGSCALGSTAVVTDTTDRYILNGEKNQWIKISGSGGGGGGGSDYDIADKDDIDSLF